MEGRGKRRTEEEDRGWKREVEGMGRGLVDGGRGCRGQGQAAGWQTVPCVCVCGGGGGGGGVSE